MECKKAAALLEDFREEALPAADEAALHEHLSECKRCRHALSNIDILEERLRNAMAVAGPSDGFAARMRTAIQLAGQPKPPRPVEWSRPVALAAAACAVVSLVVWYLTTPEPEPADPEPQGVVAIFHHDQVPQPNRPVKPKQVVKPVARREFPPGKAFVIGRKDTKPYDGPTYMRVVRIVDGTPELMVDAFPGG
ncbi:zf-HC2 domain-containing protein [Verrucomicrobiota bacterium]